VCGALVGTLSNKKEFPTKTSSGEVADHRELHHIYKGAPHLGSKNSGGEKADKTSLLPQCRRVGNLEPLGLERLRHRAERRLAVPHRKAVPVPRAALQDEAIALPVDHVLGRRACPPSPVPVHDSLGSRWACDLLVGGIDTRVLQSLANAHAPRLPVKRRQAVLRCRVHHHDVFKRHKLCAACRKPVPEDLDAVGADLAAVVRVEHARRHFCGGWLDDVSSEPQRSRACRRQK
jgi:hypothetical protein